MCECMYVCVWSRGKAISEINMDSVSRTWRGDAEDTANTYQPHAFPGADSRFEDLLTEKQKQMLPSGWMAWSGSDTKGLTVTKPARSAGPGAPSRYGDKQVTGEAGESAGFGLGGPSCLSARKLTPGEPGFSL